MTPRGHRGCPLPEIDAKQTIGRGRYLRAELLRGVLVVHLEIVWDMPGFHVFVRRVEALWGNMGLAFIWGRSSRRRRTMTRSFLSLMYSSTLEITTPLRCAIRGWRLTRFLIHVEKGHVEKFPG